jgi:hypothetical protein
VGLAQVPVLDAPAPAGAPVDVAALVGQQHVVGAFLGRVTGGWHGTSMDSTKPPAAVSRTAVGASPPAHAGIDADSLPAAARVVHDRAEEQAAAAAGQAQRAPVGLERVRLDGRARRHYSGCSDRCAHVADRAHSKDSAALTNRPASPVRQPCTSARPSRIDR